MTTTAMTFDEAKALRVASDADARNLTRKPKYELVAIERSELAAQGITRIMGGPVSKDELVNAILDLRYPRARRTEAIHVLYHGPNCRSDVCEYCITARAAQ